MVATMAWWSVTEYLRHKWPWICSACRNHNPMLSSFITLSRYVWKDTTGSTSRAGTAYLSGEPHFTPVFCGIPVAQYLVFCKSLFALVSFFSFGHCIVCLSSIYCFQLPLWYLQNCLILNTVSSSLNKTASRTVREDLQETIFWILTGNNTLNTFLIPALFYILRGYHFPKACFSTISLKHSFKIIT